MKVAEHIQPEEATLHHSEVCNVVSSVRKKKAIFVGDKDVDDFVSTSTRASSALRGVRVRDEGEDTSGNGSGAGSGGSGVGTGIKDGSSRDESSSCDDVPAADHAQPKQPEELDDGAARPSLQRNGPSLSIGSAQHPAACNPCAFYCFSLRGCRNGEQCTYCHALHESKLKQRREEWKKVQREKRGQLRLHKTDARAGSSQSAEELQPEELRTHIGELDVYADTLQHEEVDTLQPGNSNSSTGSARAGITQPFSMDVFAYSPQSVAVTIGESFDLWPPMHVISSGLVFAISPDLPPGVVLDQTSGLIHGTPKEATGGAVVHFVNACKPGSEVMHVAASLVSIKVTEPHSSAPRDLMSTTALQATAVSMDEAAKPWYE